MPIAHKYSIDEYYKYCESGRITLPSPSTLKLYLILIFRQV
jgi:hypothetical protein